MVLTPDVQSAIITLAAGAIGFAVVQLARFADTIARVDERLKASLQCCAERELEAKEQRSCLEEHTRALAKAGLL